MNEETNHKLYHSIGEVSQLVGIEVSTLRYWEREFQFFLSPRKTPKGTRYYKDEDIEKVRMIIYLRNEKGLGIEGIRKKLKDNLNNAVQNHEIIARLKKIKEELLNIRKELEPTE
ncbi:MAG: MerR family transcriptional regulator [Candidatus Azobacteroides sp.]|nr:MerR family transcriptional regulator [Candidatus Azobacteroides sp.]